MPYYTKNTRARIKKVFKKLQQCYYTPLCELSVTAYVTREPVPFAERMSGELKTLHINDVWGGLFDCAWFHFEGSLPEGLDIADGVLLIDISGEGLCVDKNGDPLIGITNGSVAWENAATRKRTVPLLMLDIHDGNIDLWMDAGCNGLFGTYDSGKLIEAHIARRHSKLRTLYYDFFVLKETMEQLPETSARYHCILHALNEACNVLWDYTDEEAVIACEKLIPELIKTGGDPSLNITAIGHAHIDLAWLWPIRETIRKGARTFATVDRLMDLYPEYKFGFSQPQLLAWMKEYYPALYKRLQARVDEGRIECQGAMWVECDTNIAGGESLVRQIQHGLSFWREEFGVNIDNIWLPDVFGYTAALPQIMRKSGLCHFMTQKLSWSEHNEFPHHTFIWEGLDGSSVLTHMLPEGTYNSQAGPEALHATEVKYLDKGICKDALLLFGVGDGGGGPGACHLEKLSRLKDMNGLPRVEQGFARDLLARLEKNMDMYSHWQGELYLEYHRGTYTSQARNKMYNRRMELALRELEYASVLAMTYAGRDYPERELHEIWDEVLLYQFHDILPGSSIKRVYDESIERYEIIYKRTCDLIKEAYGSLVSSKTVFNSVQFEREEYIYEDERWNFVKIPAMGSTSLRCCNEECFDGISASEGVIENEYMRINVGKNGEIISIYDKIRRCETLEASANVFAIYDDSHGDAWDIQIYYEEQTPRHFVLKSSRSYTDGPDAVIEQTFAYGKSLLTQKIILRHNCPFVIFDTNVDWHETGLMLRTEFATDVHVKEVTCDIQFGSIKRPTHRNTSWDMTKFEICAHKWIDISDDCHGAALLSDSKYGFKAKGNVLDINLLRSSMYPGVDADKGEHHFRYAFYPHVGNEKSALVEQKALAFNIPLVTVQGNGADAVMPASFITVDKSNIEITAVKKAKDSDDIIVRLYETNGASTSCLIGIPEQIKKVHLCMITEECMSEMNPAGGLNLDFGPYEIHTLRLCGCNAE